MKKMTFFVILVSFVVLKEEGSFSLVNFVKLINLQFDEIREINQTAN